MIKFFNNFHALIFKNIVLWDIWKFSKISMETYN